VCPGRDCQGEPVVTRGHRKAVHLLRFPAPRVESTRRIIRPSPVRRRRTWSRWRFRSHVGGLPARALGPAGRRSAASPGRLPPAVGVPCLEQFRARHGRPSACMSPSAVAAASTDGPARRRPLLAGRRPGRHRRQLAGRPRRGTGVWCESSSRHRPPSGWPRTIDACHLWPETSRRTGRMQGCSRPGPARVLRQQRGTASARGRTALPLRAPPVESR
jgi:hypothetical protein